MKKETLNTMCSQVRRKGKEELPWCCQQSLLVIVYLGMLLPFTLQSIPNSIWSDELHILN